VRFSHPVALAPMVLTLSLLTASVASLSLASWAAPPAKRPPAVNLSNQYNAYVNKLRGKILNVWDYPSGKNHVVLEATVGNDGSVVGVVLKSTPKSNEAEQSANGAFAQVQPLEALPAGTPPNVKITLTFDSSADPHGDSSSSLGAKLDPIQPPKLQPAAAQAPAPQ